jgi:iron complex outermembrane receptor protein
VLNIVTAAPSSTFGGKAMLLTTDDGEKRAGFTVTGPISDTVRARLTVSKSDYDGNLKNLTTGKNVNGSSGLTATAKIEWTPTENLKLSLAPRFNHNVSSCCTSAITELTPGLNYQGEPGFPRPPPCAGSPSARTTTSSGPTTASAAAIPRCSAARPAWTTTSAKARP